MRVPVTRHRPPCMEAMVRAPQRLRSLLSLLFLLLALSGPRLQAQTAQPNPEELRPCAPAPSLTPALVYPCALPAGLPRLSSSSTQPLTASWAAPALSPRSATLGVILAHTAVLAWYGKTHWWQDGFSGDFRTQREGWFGRNTYSGGADKLGHFFMTYAGTRLYARAFEGIGNERSDAQRLAAWLVFGSFTGVEVLDGFSRQWRFSREDTVMNVAGIGLGLLMERSPQLDRLLDVRIHYLPSEGKEFNPFGDYSGQTYLLVAKAAGVPGWRERPWLKYLELAVGYGSRGYEGDDPQSRIRGTRNLYVGVSLNLSALLEARTARSTHAGQPPNLFVRAAQTGLEYVQVPGTGVAMKHPLD